MNSNHHILKLSINYISIHPMDANTLIIVLQSQDSDYGRTSTLRKLINTVGSVSSNVVIRCAGLYDSDHGRGECLGLLCSKVNSFDSASIAQLLKCFDSDHGRGVAVTHLSGRFSTISSSQIANILGQFDSDHGRTSSLKTMSPKISSVTGKDLESILRTFDSDHGKNSAVEALSQKIVMDAQSMVSASNQFDSDHAKTSMIERMAGYLQPSATKIPIISFWTSLGSVNDEKKLALIQQNIDSLDLSFTNATTFCNLLSSTCDDVKIFVSLCALCNIPENIYNEILARMAKESSVITICGEQHDINEYEIGRTYKFEFTDDDAYTCVQFCRKMNNQAYVSTKTVNKKYGSTSTCSSTITLKRGVKIEKGNIFS